MRRLVKRLLRKYKYPPERADGAVNIVNKASRVYECGGIKI